MSLKFYFLTDDEDKIWIDNENGYLGSAWLYRFGDRWYWNIIIPEGNVYLVEVRTLREVVEIAHCCEAMRVLGEMT